MTAFDIWLLSVCGNLASFFKFAAGLSFVLFVTVLLTSPMWLYELDLDASVLKKLVLWFVPSWVLCTLLALAVPDTKTLVAMYGISYVTNIDRVKDVPPELVKFIRKFMSDYVEEK